MTGSRSFPTANIPRGGCSHSNLCRGLREHQRVFEEALALRAADELR